MGIARKSGGAKVGDVKPLFAATVPNGWLLCYGQAVSRVTYASLFLALGTLHGAGDGVNTFNLPDLRGRSLVGRDDMGGSPANRVTSGGSGINGASLGAVGGSETVTLSNNQTPSHNHSLGNGNVARPVSGSAAAYATIDGGVAANSGTGFNGSSEAHNNLPPSIICNYIIKT